MKWEVSVSVVPVMKLGMPLEKNKVRLMEWKANITPTSSSILMEI